VRPNATPRFGSYDGRAIRGSVDALVREDSPNVRGRGNAPVDRDRPDPGNAAPVAIHLGSRDIQLKATPQSGIYRGAVPVEVAVSAQWAQWRVVCVVEGVKAPRGSTFSAADIFVRGALSPVGSERGGMVMAKSRLHSKVAAGGAGEEPGVAAFNKPQVVAMGNRPQRVMAQVASLEFLVNLGERQPFGTYEFYVQFFGEGGAQTRPFRGPRLPVRLVLEPSTHLNVDPQAMEFGSLTGGEHLSVTHPNVTVVTNQDTEILITLQEQSQGARGEAIGTERMALGVGTSPDEADTDARGTALGTVEKKVSVKAGETVKIYMTGKIRMDGAVSTGEYAGSINIRAVRDN
jgi:hypothetical protein